MGMPRPVQGGCLGDVSAELRSKVRYMRSPLAIASYILTLGEDFAFGRNLRRSKVRESNIPKKYVIQCPCRPIRIAGNPRKCAPERKLIDVNQTKPARSTSPFAVGTKDGLNLSQKIREYVFRAVRSRNHLPRRKPTSC